MSNQLVALMHRHGQRREGVDVNPPLCVHDTRMEFMHAERRTDDDTFATLSMSVHQGVWE
jgi:hypothetical protein